MTSKSKASFCVEEAHKSAAYTTEMATKMVIKQPQAVLESRESDEWASGVCDCGENVPECCLAFWFCPCFACKTTKKYGQCLCLPLLDLCGVASPATWAMRVSMRQRYGIKGTLCDDCLVATFCTPCVWCQMSREMKNRAIPIALVNARPKN